MECEILALFDDVGLFQELALGHGDNVALLVSDLVFLCSVDGIRRADGRAIRGFTCGRAFGTVICAVGG